MDTYYDCIWDVTLLEYLISILFVPVRSQSKVENTRALRQRKGRAPPSRATTCYHHVIRWYDMSRGGGSMTMTRTCTWPHKAAPGKQSLGIKTETRWLGCAHWDTGARAETRQDHVLQDTNVARVCASGFSVRVFSQAEWPLWVTVPSSLLCRHRWDLSPSPMGNLMWPEHGSAGSIHKGALVSLWGGGVTLFCSSMWRDKTRMKQKNSWLRFFHFTQKKCWLVKHRTKGSCFVEPSRHVPQPGSDLHARRGELDRKQMVVSILWELRPVTHANLNRISWIRMTGVWTSHTCGLTQFSWFAGEAHWSAGIKQQQSTRNSERSSKNQKRPIFENDG